MNSDVSAVKVYIEGTVSSIELSKDTVSMTIEDGNRIVIESEALVREFETGCLEHSIKARYQFNGIQQGSDHLIYTYYDEDEVYLHIASDNFAAYATKEGISVECDANLIIPKKLLPIR